MHAHTSMLPICTALDLARTIGGVQLNNYLERHLFIAVSEVALLSFFSIDARIPALKNDHPCSFSTPCPWCMVKRGKDILRLCEVKMSLDEALSCSEVVEDERAILDGIEDTSG